ncbi:hypothetical protein KVT40_008751 [Elsinoe batatas]|uniref:Uncharacterized protein n=1 Tax=Elsinoe batatas TaxID=2601811 RepID=A0A8K0P9S6_9PEZI|nr:hypothetical protein KVT40_008751 [Elsinoe batatas]
MADERHSTGFALVSMWLLLLRSEPTEPPLNGRRDLLIGITLCTHSKRIHPSIDDLPLATDPILQVILRWMPAKAEMAEGDPFLTQRMIDTDDAPYQPDEANTDFFPHRRIYADLLSLLASTSRNAFLSPSNTSGCGITTAPD